MDESWRPLMSAVMVGITFFVALTMIVERDREIRDLEVQVEVLGRALMTAAQPPEEP